MILMMMDQDLSASGSVRNGKLQGGYGTIIVYSVNGSYNLSLTLKNTSICSNNMLYPKEDKENKVLLYAVSTL